MYFNFKYKDKYYMEFYYDLTEDKLFLETYNHEWWDSESEYLHGAFEGYEDELEEYLKDYQPNVKVEITFDDLKDLYIRSFGDSPPFNFTKIF